MTDQNTKPREFWIDHDDIVHRVPIAFADFHVIEYSAYLEESSAKARWYDYTQKLLDVKEELIKDLKAERTKNQRLVEALTEATDVLIKCIQEAGNRGTQRAIIPMIKKWKALAANSEEK